jgi:hypothetical protein
MINDGYPLMFWQTGGTLTLLPPENLLINVNGGIIYLSWDEVEGANSYEIYSSPDPYISDWGLPVAVVGYPEYSEFLTGVSMFYRVIASTEEPVLSRVPDPTMIRIRPTRRMSRN